MTPRGKRSSTVSDPAGRRVSRRALLIGAASGAAALALPVGAARATTPAATHYLVPGYAPGHAYFQGRPVSAHPAFTRRLPADHAGPVTLLTRVDGASGAVTRALMPLIGHHIAISPDRETAFFSSLNDHSMVTFDPATLEIDTVLPPHAEGFMGGGHAAFSADGRTLFVVERRDWRAYAGRPEDHFGRVVVRDGRDFALLDVIDCHGIAPHDLAITGDDAYLVIANYGRTLPADGRADYDLPTVVEPSLTVLDAQTGALVHKAVNDDPRFELRHVAARDPAHIMAIQARLARFADSQSAMADWADVYEPDLLSAGAGLGYTAAPARHYRRDGDHLRSREMITADSRLMRYGQTIVHDPAHDQFIATYPTRHRVLVFDAPTGRVVRAIDTASLGLRHPRGLALLPDGTHYAVSGYWNDIFVFTRDTHTVVRDACRYETWFGHSHMTAFAG